MSIKANGYRIGAIAAAFVTALGVAGCGGSSETAKPSITDQSDLGKGVSLTYDSRTAVVKPKHVEITQGQVVFIAVVSDVAGTLTVEGHGVERAVPANEVTTMVISADDSGSFDVTLKGQGVDTQLAELQVIK